MSSRHSAGVDWRAAVRRRAGGGGLDLPRETIDELAEHLADVYAASRRDGLSGEAARRRAMDVLEGESLEGLRRHASRDPYRFRHRQTDDLARTVSGRSLPVFASLRMAVRHFRQHPLFALVTMLVLGLGTGAAATVFSIVDTVVLRPLPYARPDRLVAIRDTNTEQGLSHDPISPVNFMDQRDLPVFEDAAAWWRPGVNLTDPGLDPVRVTTIETSANLFEVLGVAPLIGPGFPPTTARPGIRDGRGADLQVRKDVELFSREPIATISERLWRSRYGADPSIVGRQLQMNGVGVLIVGVMPPGFQFPDEVDVWQRMNWDMREHSRSAHFMEAVARLSDGVSIEQVQAAVDALWPRLEEQFGATRNSPGHGWGSRIVPLLDDQLGYYRPALFVLFGAVGLLLAIGALNVASLLLTRVLSRERELAIRVALGATGRQLVAQLLAESFVLSIGGAVVGVVAAAAALPLVVAYVPVQIPRLAEVAISWRTIGLGLAVAGVTTAAFGLAPTLVVLRGQVHHDLKSAERGSTRGARRVYSVLVGAEVALACALVASSALLVRTVRHMTDTPLGVAADATVITPIQLTASSASNAIRLEQWQQLEREHRQVLDAIREQPGVDAAGAANFLPLQVGWRVGVGLDGEPVSAVVGESPQVQLHSVSEGYFDAMGATIASGRPFSAFDTADSTGVAIVNQTFVRRLFPDGRAPVGRSIRVGAQAIGPLGRNITPGFAEPGGMSFEIVGVIDDIRNVPLGQETEPAVFLSTQQFPFAETYFAVKAASMTAAVSAVRNALRAVAPLQPMGEPRTWGDRFSAIAAEQRLLMSVLLIFGGLAGLLAAIGVYGLFSWSVAIRRRELAIRLALGASPAEVGRAVVAQSLGLAAAGLVAGLVIVRVSERALASVVYGVTPGDPQSLGSAGMLLLVAALAACVPPAVRAMRVDPMEGLRVE